MTTILELRDFGVAFADKVILSKIHLEVGDRGVFTILGPGGAGKSTLLRSLAGWNDSNPTFQMWGEVTFAGQPLSASNRPSLMRQRAQLFLCTVIQNIVSGLVNRSNYTAAEAQSLLEATLERMKVTELIPLLETNVVDLPLGLQRKVALARILINDPKMLCLDEPLRDLDKYESEALFQIIAREAENRSILLVEHRQDYAQRFNGTACLLSAGKVQEVQPSDVFFSSPERTITKQFIHTGGCALESDYEVEQESEIGNESDESNSKKTNPGASVQRYPSGFRWLWKNKLAGMARPGLFAAMEEDFEALREAGITRILTLEETPLDLSLAETHDMKFHFFPIQDMECPSLENARKLAFTISQWLEQGEMVVAHCRAGLGRTGLVLACQLIWCGMPAVSALEEVRILEPLSVQSNSQHKFLQLFEEYLIQEGKECSAEDFPELIVS